MMVRTLSSIILGGITMSSMEGGVSGTGAGTEGQVHGEEFEISGDNQVRLTYCCP